MEDGGCLNAQVKFVTPLPITILNFIGGQIFIRSGGEKMAISKDEKEKVLRIKKEYEKLKKSFEELPEVNMNIVDGLVERTAFLRITLEDMEDDIIKHGVTEKFTQSEKTEPYDRQRPATQIYNQMSGNYQKMIKELVSHLPMEYQEKSDSPEEIMNTFINRREAG